MKKKVIAIGLDGATYDLIKPWVDEGLLPNFKKIFNNGVHGVLETTIPPVTGSAWASFFTGKNPGSHGVYGFLDFDKERKKVFVNNASNVGAEKIWNILERNGMMSIVFNVPMTYPVEAIDGIMFTGMQTPSRFSTYAHPKELEKEIDRKFGKYDTFEVVGFNIGQEEKYIKKIFDTMDKRHKIADYFLKEKEWDLFIYVAREPDLTQHFFWKKMVNNEEYGDVILNVHKELDKFIGKIMDDMDENTTLVLMSDHGAALTHHEFFVNRFLIEKGYLHLEKTHTGSKLGDMKNIFYNKILLPLRLEWIRKYIPIDFKKKLVATQDLKIDEAVVNNLIQWDNTGAIAIWQPKTACIYLNHMDGINPKDLSRQLKQDFENYFAQEGMDVKIYNKEDIFHGDYIKNAPDLVLFSQDKTMEINESLKKGPLHSEISDVRRPAEHTLYGIFGAYGESIKGGLNLDGMHITDIAPTILALMDIAIPEDMDGKVNPEIFKHKVNIKVDNKASKIQGKVEEYSSDDEDKIKSRLKDLGYM